MKIRTAYDFQKGKNANCLKVRPPEYWFLILFEVWTMLGSSLGRQPGTLCQLSRRRQGGTVTVEKLLMFPSQIQKKTEADGTKHTISFH